MESFVWYIKINQIQSTLEESIGHYAGNNFAFSKIVWGWKDFDIGLCDKDPLASMVRHARKAAEKTIKTNQIYIEHHRTPSFRPKAIKKTLGKPLESLERPRGFKAPNDHHLGICVWGWLQREASEPDLRGTGLVQAATRRWKKRKWCPKGPKLLKLVH